jgi:hypothetical protein
VVCAISIADYRAQAWVLAEAGEALALASSLEEAQAIATRIQSVNEHLLVLISVARAMTDRGQFEGVERLVSTALGYPENWPELAWWATPLRLEPGRLH